MYSRVPKPALPLALLLLVLVPKAARAQEAPDAGVPTPAPTDVTPPTIDKRVDAEIPPGALAPGQTATVTLAIAIDAAGVVTDATVVEPVSPELDAAALAAVKQWTFHPALRGDRPIKVKGVRVSITFSIPAAPAPAPAPVPTPTPPATPAPAPLPAPVEPPAEPVEPPAAAPGELSATVRGRARPRSRGASDFHISVGQLGASVIPRKNATEMLKLAPGFLLTNEGGEGHAEQVFLRGFDAREGQDIEMRVNGDVVNEVGNLHGNGYADLHFVLPELVESLRVVEGPFDPRQGNFAVAGSADYELGLAQRGLTAGYESGSFNTRRALVLWGPPGHGAHTFGGAEIYETDGFGKNRDARRGTAMGQIETKLGDDGTFRLTSSAYLTDYHSAGVLREDDYRAGRKGFYDTYDFNQGGAATRFFVLGDVETKSDDVTYHEQISLSWHTLRLREDFTGFLLDQQTPVQNPHAQRGDLLDLESDGFTIQSQGWARKRGTFLGHSQELELGYFARLDTTSGTEYRIEAATKAPYHKDSDLDATLGDLGLYADANLRLLRWLVLRGGGRTDLLTYDVIDNCAVHEAAHPPHTNPPGDQSCLSLNGPAYREPVQRATTSGSVFMPRASVLVGPFAGVTGSLSYGIGVRSIDPSYITQDVKTPFASINAYEAGLAYEGRPADIETTAHLTVFRTTVDRDLVFSETAGRNLISGGTSRTGASLSGRATGKFFDEAASATLVQSTFDETGLLIPYVPDLVLRSDSSVFGHLPWRIADEALSGTAGLGVTYVGRRALPYGERSDAIFTIDGSASLRFQHYTVGLSVANLLDTRYRLGEFNYASDFHSQPSPTLVIDRHFTAGAPRTVLLRLEVNL